MTSLRLVPPWSCPRVVRLHVTLCVVRIVKALTKPRGGRSDRYVVVMTEMRKEGIQKE